VGIRRGLAVLGVVTAIVVECPPSRAETSSQLWPKVEVHLRSDKRVRVQLFVRSRIAPASQFVSIQSGGWLEVSVPPLREIVFPSIQTAKKEHATLALGVLYGAPIDEGTLGGSQEARATAGATFRLLLPAGVLASDRNRGEGRRLDGEWSLRYRNRLELERTFGVGSARLVPFVNAEVFFDSRYDAWSRLRLEAGFDLEELVSHRSVIELYLLRQDDSRSQPSTVDGIGVVLKLYL
jgi:hypothetical protein